MHIRVETHPCLPLIPSWTHLAVCSLSLQNCQHVSFAFRKQSPARAVRCLSSTRARASQVPLSQLYREWRPFDDPEKTGEIEIEIFLKEDRAPSPRIKTDGKKPKGSLLQQMEAKERRDQLRANARKDAELADREQLFR